MTEEQLRDLATYRTSEAFSPLERLVVDFTVALTLTPAGPSDALFAQLRAHFDEGQLVELAGTIAWENWRARFNRAFDVSTQGFSEGAYCPLPERPDGTG